MDLFRAFMQQPEFSARTLALTSHLIRLNPSNYTLWAYRARIILSEASAGAGEASPSSEPEDPFIEPLPADLRRRLDSELDFMDVLAKANMKNYQVWQHRKVIVTALTKSVCEALHAGAGTTSLGSAAAEWKSIAARELEFVRDTLNNDAKNYHTWVYRQWVLCHMGGLPSQGKEPDAAHGSSLEALRREAGPAIWDGELPYVQELLEDDLRNNSAWANRFFTLFGSGRAAAGATSATSAPSTEAEAAVISQEVDWTLGKLDIAPNNSSAWSYLRGIIARPALDSSVEHSRAALRGKVDAYAQTLAARGDASADASEQLSKQVPLALEWLVDSAAEKAQVDRANAYLDQLKVADPMRVRYWEYVRSTLST